VLTSDAENIGAELGESKGFIVVVGDMEGSMVVGTSEDMMVLFSDVGAAEEMEGAIVPFTKVGEDVGVAVLKFPEIGDGEGAGVNEFSVQL
jgi:hypothetical protein